MSPFTSIDWTPPSRRRTADIDSLIAICTAVGSTSGILPLPLFFSEGGGSDVEAAAAGVGGELKSAKSEDDAKTSPPNASNNSACFVFFDPSFMPEPLKAGARVVLLAGVGDAVLMRDGRSGASKRGTGA